jgi:hypothetical protein
MANPEHLAILRRIVRGSNHLFEPSGVSYQPESCRDGRENLPKHKALIVCYPRLLQQRQKFLFETPFRVMLRLLVNVINYGLSLRLAHTEGAVSLLPREA